MDILCVAVPYLYLFCFLNIYIYFLFVCLQGGHAFALKVGQNLPLRAVHAKAPSTTERYSRAFKKFSEWASSYQDMVCLLSNELSVALYFEFLLQSSCPYSTLESACYGIHWAHNLYGFPSPCDSKLAKNILEAGKRELAKPVPKKDRGYPLNDRESVPHVCRSYRQSFRSSFSYSLCYSVYCISSL